MDAFVIDPPQTLRKQKVAERHKNGATCFITCVTDFMDF